MNTRKLISCVIRDLRDNTPTTFTHATTAAEYRELTSLAHTYGIAFTPEYMGVLETNLRLDMGLQTAHLEGPAPVYVPKPTPTKAPKPTPATPATPATQGRTQADVRSTYTESPRVNSTQAERQTDTFVMDTAALRKLTPAALRSQVSALKLALTRTEEALAYRVSDNGRAAASHANAAARAAAVPATPTNVATRTAKQVEADNAAARDAARDAQALADAPRKAAAAAAQAAIAQADQARHDAHVAAQAQAALIARIQSGNMNSAGELSPALARMLLDMTR